MKRYIAFTLIAGFAVVTLQGCGPSEEELRQQELARQDSLRQVYEEQMEQMRLDSLRQANLEAESDQTVTEETRPVFEYSENGRFSVQIEAWRSEEKAREQAGRWKQRDFPNAYVVEYGDPDKGDVWYRVRLGRFGSLDMANNFRQMLHEDYNTQSWISEDGVQITDATGE